MLPGASGSLRNYLSLFLNEQRGVRAPAAAEEVRRMPVPEPAVPAPTYNTVVHFIRGGPTVQTMTMRPNQTATAFYVGGDWLQFCLIFSHADWAVLQPLLGGQNLAVTRMIPDGAEWRPHSAVTQHFTRQNRPLELRVQRVAAGTPSAC